MTLSLKDIYFFQWVNKELIEKIIDNSRRITKKAWEIIISQAEDSDNNAYIIQKWTVIVEINNNFITQLREWNVFGEIALITNEPRTATVKAETDVTLLKINKNLLLSIIKEAPNWKEIQKKVFERIMQNLKK